MGFFSGKVPKKIEIEPTILYPSPIIEDGFMDGIIESFEKANKRDFLYKNYSDSENCNLTYLDDDSILYSNYKMIKTYRKNKTILVKPEALKKIILENKLEIGFLNDTTFPILKKTKRHYENLSRDIEYYGSKDYTLAKTLNLIGIDVGYSNAYGFSSNDLEERKVVTDIIPCYSYFYDLDNKEDTIKDRFLVLGKNLQFKGENITDEKMINAVIFHYNPNMKLFAILQDTKWSIDNRPESEKAMKFVEYVDSKKIPEPPQSRLILD